MTTLKLLAVSASRGRLGYVFLRGGELMEWRISAKAATASEAAAAFAQRLITRLGPDVVVTERDSAESRKRQHSREIIAAVTRTAERNELLSLRVTRQRRHRNRQAEAEALAAAYPDLTPWLPEPQPFYETAGRNFLLFDALALATQPWQGGAQEIAAAMG